MKRSDAGAGGASPDATRAVAYRERAAQLAREAAVPLVLPSGTEILARRPGPMQMAMWERLPQGLAAIAGGGPAPAPEQLTDTDVREIAGWMKEILVFCFIDPEIGDGPDQLRPRDLLNDDLQFVLAWAMRGEEAAQLGPFRRRRSDADAGGNREDVQPAPERAAGDRGPGPGPGFRPGGSRESGEGGIA